MGWINEYKHKKYDEGQKVTGPAWSLIWAIFKILVLL